jgi:hypothetical protein
MEDPNLLTSKNRRNVVTITEVDSMYIVHDVIADVITIHEMLSDVIDELDDIFIDIKTKE